MISFKQFLIENVVNISHTTFSDREECLELCVKVFSNVAPKHIVYQECEKTNWKISFKASVNDKIVGCYLLSEQPVSVYEFCQLEDLTKYRYKRGIQGVALAVDSAFRNKNIGKSLRSKPLTMNYDYIWGEHFESLNNKNNWIKFGRRIVAKVDGFFVSLMDLR